MPAGRTPDDELGERLGHALRADLGDPVDVVALIEGSQGRARQIRRRRIGAAAAGVVLVVAVPFGAELLGAPDRSGPSAVLSSGEPNDRLGRTPGTPVPSPRSVGVPKASVTGINPTFPPPAPGANPLPDSLAFDTADLPAGVIAMPVAQPALAVPLVNGQQCQVPGAGDVLPLSARQWVWAEPGQTGDVRIVLTVTGWARGEGGPAFSQLIAGTGRCRFNDPLTTASASLYPGAQAWIGTSTRTGEPITQVVVRLGDLIAGIEVLDLAGTSAAQALARRLGTVAAQRLSSSGLA